MLSEEMCDKLKRNDFSRIYGGGTPVERHRKEILIDRATIAARVAEMGQQITRDYPEVSRPLVVISILKGAIPFTADLIRAIDRPLRLETMVASSYGSGTVSSGKVNIKYRSFDDLSGCDVILVDDIIDSGNTLAAIKRTIADFQPASVATCVFLNKPERREVEMPIDYMGMDVPDVFVIGYGLDYDGQYRELADICAVVFEEEE